MLNEQRKQEVTEICQKLIQNPSSSGNEEGVVKAIEESFEKLGFDNWSRDRYGNIVGCIKGNKPGKKILFDGHIDTVPVPDASKWSVPPFEGKIVDGKIYGRGTSDMKGQYTAMMSAVAYFAKDTNRDFAGELYVAGVVHEEIFEGVSAREISKAVQPDYVVIGESSELNLKIGQRGRGEIVVETFGKPAHSANPEKGVNAVYKMANVIQKIQQLVPPTHPVLGDGILVLTDIKSSPYPGASVVPDYCKATFDRRLLVGETREGVLAPIQALLDEMMKEDPELNAKVSYAVEKADCYTGNTIESERFFPGWLYDEEDEFVQAAYKGLKEAGIDSEITQYSFCTNGSHYAGEAGIKTIGFGPSKENLAHTIDEYIEQEQLFIGTEGYYGILKSVYGK
ncbi:TPA: YgeY family selenium metabolism-linked hydrolase [Clostridioides difficile]|uniref:YgeY family selenium metabolism-linked hydrolase n=1 Tax=Clostridioides difficile TaxID=1496 RepID=UPI0009800E4C|nr:YgeY family selenium metabolism-linked hydrolase [Clostridioides difficile]SJO00797.1 N-formyl-4-amino-5-aminomethyl-2-methylpyrimidin e deformylase [Clostridioides difficile]HDX7082663.1 YgeY family selenium metabolism-linked hydrolase [Clostridioides difficile]